MAKIKYSALVSDMRNKLNGSVMSKNRYGSYVRNKVTPVNPQSTFQQAVRSTLASLSSAWRGLTEAQRLGWTALATQLKFTDIFGDSKTLTGNTMYVKLNANLIKIGNAEINDAPLPSEFPAFLVLSATATQTAGALTALTATMNSVAIPVGFELGIFATPPVGAGISFVKNRFRFIGSSPALAASVANILALYTTRFGTAAAVGTKIFVRVALIATASGQQGIPSEAMDVVE